MIHQLRLKNFKNLRDATLGLGGLTLLIGTNASGKSNLRDAFRFVNGIARGYSLADTLGAKYVEGGSLQWTGIRGGTREVLFPEAESLVIETTFSRLPIHRVRLQTLSSLPCLRHTIEVIIEANGVPKIIRESLYRGRLFNSPRHGAGGATEKASKTNYTIGASWMRGVMVYDSHPSEDAPQQKERHFLYVRLPRGGKNRRMGKRLQFVSNQPILSQIVDHPEATPAVRNSARASLAELESMQFLDLDPDAMRKPSIPGQDILGDRGENLSSVLQTICEDEAQKAAILRWITELTPLDVTDFEFPSDLTGKILLALVEGGGHRISAYSASDGTLRFLAMIAALFGPRPAGFYFFEELDNGIHPSRLYLLLQLIEQTVGEGRIQMVATTHSPQMLGFLSEKAQSAATLVYRLNGHPEGRTTRILDIPEVKRVLEGRNLGRLHEMGWFENAVSFLQNGEDAA